MYMIENKVKQKKKQRKKTVKNNNNIDHRPFKSHTVIFSSKYRKIIF